MAYLPNPQYGYVPGAPQALNWWEGPNFRMSGIMPPPPAPLPPVSTAATVTPQDVATQVGAGMLAPQQYGGTGGSGGPGGGPGGIGGASGGGQDRTNSGFQGVYAQSPVDLESRFGEAGGLIGAGAGSLSGIPGVGTVLGFGGGMLDAARYNATNAQYGLPGHINPWGAGFAQALAGVGIPFTDLNLARAFGVPTAQQRQEALINAAAPGLYNNPGYGALAANQPVGPATVGAPMSASYPPGFLDFMRDPTRAGTVSAVEKSTAPFTEADLRGYAEALAGKGGIAADLGQSTGYASSKEGVDPGTGQATGGKGGSDPGSSGTAGGKGDVGAGQDRGSGDTSREGGADAYKYRGGLIGPPPGRYEQGGRVPAINPNDPPALTIGRTPPPPARRPETVTVPIPMWERMLLSIWGPRDEYGGVPSERRVPADGSAAPPGRYAAGGAVRAASRMPGHYYPDVMMTPPRDYMSDTERHSLGSAGQPDESGQLSPREQAIQDFMGEMFRARERNMFPEQLARGGAVGGLPPAAPGDNISPAQFGLLRGIDPPGPDDQIGALQTGEGVLTRASMKKYPGLLDAANAGKIAPKKLVGLLAVVPAKPRRQR